MISLFSCRPLGSRSNALGTDGEWDYQRVNFSIHTPTYSVKYLGSQQLYSPGFAEICDTVKAIFAQEKPKLKSFDHYSLKLTKEELSLRDRDSTEDEEKVFLLRRIRFSGVSKAYQRVFFFTYQFGSKAASVECNVVLCKSNKEAKSLAKVISKAFGDARSEFHHQEVASRKLHAEGLSENSISHLHVDAISNVEVNRQYYNISAFKNSRSNSAASAISADFRSKNRTPDKLKRSNQSCHLGASLEWERTESSLDTRQSDVEKTSTSGETFGCTCEKEPIVKIESLSPTTENVKPINEVPGYLEIAPEHDRPDGASNDLDTNDLARSSSTLEADETVAQPLGNHNSRASCDWSMVSGLEETSI